MFATLRRKIKNLWNKTKNKTKNKYSRNKKTELQVIKPLTLQEANLTQLKELLPDAKTKILKSLANRGGWIFGHFNIKKEVGLLRELYPNMHDNLIAMFLSLGIRSKNLSSSVTHQFMQNTANHKALLKAFTQSNNSMKHFGACDGKIKHNQYYSIDYKVVSNKNSPSPSDIEIEYTELNDNTLDHTDLALRNVPDKKLEELDLQDIKEILPNSTKPFFLKLATTGAFHFGNIILKQEVNKLRILFPLSDDDFIAALLSNGITADSMNNEQNIRMMGDIEHREFIKGWLYRDLKAEKKLNCNSKYEFIFSYHTGYYKANFQFKKQLTKDNTAHQDRINELKILFPGIPDALSSTFLRLGLCASNLDTSRNRDFMSDSYNMQKLYEWLNSDSDKVISYNMKSNNLYKFDLNHMTSYMQKLYINEKLNSTRNPEADVGFLSKNSSALCFKTPINNSDACLHDTDHHYSPGIVSYTV